MQGVQHFHRKDYRESLVYHQQSPERIHDSISTFTLTEH
jgi:hypothetical protein